MYTIVKRLTTSYKVNIYLSNINIKNMEIYMNVFEGVINVPETVVDEVTNIVMKMIGHYIGTNFDKKYYKEFSINGNIINNNPIYKISSSDEIIGQPFTINIEPIKYTNLTKDEIVIGLQRIDNDGRYLPDENMLIIPATRLLDSIDTLNVKDDDPTEQGFLYELLDTFHSIDKAISLYRKHIRSVIKHEMAHYIQIRYLSEKHYKQAEFNDNDDIDAYLTSNIEYSPQIITAIETFKVNTSISDFPVSKKEYFKYLVDMGGKSLGFHVETISDVMVREFFISLKKRNTKLYKKAIKYFFNEIQH